jgi:hypothetical protein
MYNSGGRCGLFGGGQRIGRRQSSRQLESSVRQLKFIWINRPPFPSPLPPPGLRSRMEASPLTPWS